MSGLGRPFGCLGSFPDLILEALAVPLDLILEALGDLAVMAWILSCPRDARMS